MKLLIDSGAVYTVLPRAVWKRLGLKAEERMELDLAGC
jgi:hypothetical protein